MKSLQKEKQPAAYAWLEAVMEDDIEIHEPDSLEDYSGQFKLRMSDARKVAPEKWKTVIRHPIRKV